MRSQRPVRWFGVGERIALDALAHTNSVAVGDQESLASGSSDQPEYGSSSALIPSVASSLSLSDAVPEL
jgi:hypothetical protein